MLEGGSGDNKGTTKDSSTLFRSSGDILSSSADSINVKDSINSNEGAVLHEQAMRDSSGGIVVARGTGDGLILRLDGRVERHILLKTLLDYVESRKSFFSGQEVTLEWVEARPEEGVVAELSESLAARFQLLVKASRMFERSAKSSSSKKSSSGLSASIEVDEYHPGSRLRSTDISMGAVTPRPVAPRLGERAPSPNISGSGSYGSSGFGSNASSPIGSSSLSTASTSLFDGVAALSGTSSGSSYSTGTPSSSAQDKRSISSESLLWDEADARIIRETLRGGQKIESEHSVVIVGDVNSGAEIVAGGDIFVLGRLRGVAHAGAYDESGGGRKIFALQMQPTQLRIGSVISQGSEEGGRMPEMAKIEGNMIVVEPYGAGSQVKRLSR